MTALTIFAVAIGFEVKADFGFVVLCELRLIPEFVSVVGKGALL